MRKLAILAIVLVLPWSAMAQSESDVEVEENSAIHLLAIGAGVVGGAVIAGILTPIIILPVLEATGTTAWVAESGLLAGEAVGARAEPAIAANRTFFERLVLGTTTAIGAITGGFFGDWAYRT